MAEIETGTEKVDNTAHSICRMVEWVHPEPSHISI
jgi:hypothetical protein